MARRRRNSPRPSTVIAISLIVAVLVIGIIGCCYRPVSQIITNIDFDSTESLSSNINSVFDSIGEGIKGFELDFEWISDLLAKLNIGKREPAVIPAEGEIVVHFVDVGQGDCTVICTPKGNIIIDAGTNSSQDEMDAYIKSLGIESFEYAIFTHPHEDHIGGAEVIMNNYDVANVIIPDMEATSKVYETMLDSIEKSDANVIVIEAGKSYDFTVGSLMGSILGPIEIGDDPNNASIVTKLTFGKTKLLIMGDAEAESEELLLKKHMLTDVLDADILKLGHHGSRTSSTEEFLKKVSPSVAIISCGVDNSYGHPHAETIKKLNDQGIEYHRTDTEGTVIYTVNADGYYKK